MFYVANTWNYSSRIQGAQEMWADYMNGKQTWRQFQYSVIKTKIYTKDKQKHRRKNAK